jgi:hypothetical protein
LRVIINILYLTKSFSDYQFFEYLFI